MADNPLPRSGIYCIRNLVSGRVYVGSAVYIKQRWSGHRALLRKGNHHARILQRSWDKHGAASFSFEILEAVESARDLVAREQYWIDALHAACPMRGFNASPTAGSPLGVKHSAETRAKQSAARKGKKFGAQSAEHRANLGAAKRGRKFSAEARANMSAARKGKKRSTPFSAEHRARLAASAQSRIPALVARNRSPEHRKKVSLGKTGSKASPETLAKMSAANKGKKLSAETRQKISAIHKGRKKSAAHHKKLAALLAKRNRRRSVGDLTDQLKLL